MLKLLDKDNNPVGLSHKATYTTTRAFYETQPDEFHLKLIYINYILFYSLCHSKWTGGSTLKNISVQILGGGEIPPSPPSRIGPAQHMIVSYADSTDIVHA
jgi:hypothetical protein